MDVSSRRSRLLLTLAFLLVVPAADVASGPDTAFNGSYSLAALLAATISSVRWTAAVGGAAVALSLASRLWNPEVDTSEWAVRAVLTVVLSAMAVWLAGIRVRREQDLQQMTTIAETAQRALLRAAPERVGALSFATRYVSATRAALVGGDLYDVASSPYGVRVVVGDVRGKGLEGVQLAGTVLKAFRRSAPRVATLTELAAALDTVVTAVAGEEEFVTCVLVELHEDSTVTVVSCGHPPPILADGAGHGSLLETDPALPLGLGPEPHERTFPWPAGARMLLYTDGLIEARDAEGRFFPLEEHLDDVTGADLDDALDRLVDDVVSHSGGRIQDDLALILADRG